METTTETRHVCHAVQFDVSTADCPADVVTALLSSPLTPQPAYPEVHDRLCSSSQVLSTLSISLKTAVLTACLCTKPRISWRRRREIYNACCGRRDLILTTDNLIVTVQRHFWQGYAKDAPSDKCIRQWYRQFQETNSVVKGHPPGRPNTSDDEE
jgi:hypothetical protein